MPRSHKHGGKFENCNEASQHDFLEGTSARTRPLSFDDIMLRRKNKGHAAKHVVDGPGDSDIALAGDNVEKAFHSIKSNEKTNEDSVPMSSRHTANENQKVASRRKGDANASRKNGKFVLKDKGLLDHVANSRVSVDKTASTNRVTTDKNARHYHSSRSNDGISGDDFCNESDIKRTQDLVKSDRVPERPRVKSEINKEQLDNRDEHIYRKRKTDERVGSFPENESQKRNARDATRTSKVSDRGKDISEKESRRNRNNEEDKTRGRSIVEKHDSVPENESQKRNARDLIQSYKVSDRGKDISEKESRHNRHNEEDKTRGRSIVEKHGSVKKELELKRVYLEESRSKRRRSRSTEHDRDKERCRRYPLHSPKVHKHISKDKREHEEMPSHSIKDRAGREHSDAEKKRISSNGSSTHYRWNTGSSSGLGGYSPRKRKSDTAAKTPSPTHRSPERRNAGWDLLPVVDENIIAGSSSAISNLHASSQNLPSNLNEYPSGTLLTSTMMKPFEIAHTTLSSRMQAIESIQLTQATRPMRRLYVENVPASASDKDLMGCINKFLVPSGINYVQGTQPCISCIIHKEKGQALLEFLTPEDASAALYFDGISFSGSNLKIRRPKDYADVTTGLPDKSVVAVHSVSDIVEDSPNKIFVGGISKLLSSKMLLEIVKVFGPMKAYRYELIADGSEQCAFLEYVDHSATSKACAGLNGMRLGGQVLTAIRATPDAVLVENKDKEPFYGIPNHAKPLLENPTAVLKLKNVIDPEGLLALSEFEVEDVLEDIRLECSRFGTVKSVNISKPTNSIDTTAVHALNSNVSTDGCNLEFENKTYTTERLEESINDVGDRDRSEPSEKLNESEQNSQIEDNRGGDSSEGKSKPFPGSVEPEENLVKDDLNDADGSVRDPLNQENSGNSTGELAIQQIASVNELESNDDTSESIPVGPIEIENKPSIREELKLLESNDDTSESIPVGNFEIENKPFIGVELTLENDSSNIGKALELDDNVGKDLDAPEERSKKELSTDVFEPGSVFVEYRRAEAACTAAHCLYGRIFDGRVVTVGYVDHDLYQMAFRR